jgi:hypothetical protein
MILFVLALHQMGVFSTTLSQIFSILKGTNAFRPSLILENPLNRFYTGFLWTQLRITSYISGCKKSISQTYISDAFIALRVINWGSTTVISLAI